ncbi:MAG: hypothetical protein Q9195_005934 [Heterodermia aff. obscurata]
MPFIKKVLFPKPSIVHLNVIPVLKNTTPEIYPASQFSNIKTIGSMKIFGFAVSTTTAALLHGCLVSTILALVAPLQYGVARLRKRHEVRKYQHPKPARQVLEARAEADRNDDALRRKWAGEVEARY